MTFLQTVQASRGPAHGLPTAPGLEWWYFSAIILVILLASFHAWMVLHNRKHGCPPMFMLRLWQWWSRSGPGRVRR